MFRSIKVGSALFLVFSFTGCQKPWSNSSQQGFYEQDETLEQKIYKKFNLEYLAVGRNQIEVESLMGPPEGRSLGQNGEYLWDYRRPVLDEETGKVFDWSLITFHFNQGKCKSINFNLADRPIQLMQENESPEGN